MLDEIPGLGGGALGGRSIGVADLQGTMHGSVIAVVPGDFFDQLRALSELGRAAARSVSDGPGQDISEGLCLGLLACRS